MECRDDGVPAIGVVFRAVSSAFRDVDFAAHRPAAIDIVFGHHPDGRPEPVTLRHLCNDLDLAVLDAPLALRGHASTTNRIDNVTRGLVTIDGTHRIVWGSAGLVCRQIESVTVIDLFGCDVCCFGGQSWHNVKTLRISVRVLRVVGRPVKRAGAEASSLDLVAP